MRTSTSGFRGLNNVSDGLDLGLSWQRTADDVDVTNTGRIQRRRGYLRRVTQAANSGAYATLDEQRAFVVDNGVLKSVNPDLTVTTLESGLSTDPMYFDEWAGVVFCTNGTDYRTIQPNNRVKKWGVPAAPVPRVFLGTGVLPEGLYRVCSTLVDADGIEGSNSDVAVVQVATDKSILIEVSAVAGYTTNVYVTAADGATYYLLAASVVGSVVYSCAPDRLGAELRFWFTDVPRGGMPCMHAGRAHLAEYFPDQDQSLILFSKPLAFHTFDIGQDAFAVPGRALMLKPAGSSAPDTLIIGTDRAVYAWNGAALALLAAYGVVPGHHDALKDGRQRYFWTERGLCRAMPFQNLSDRVLSVDPGAFCGATVIERDGNVRYLVALQRGGHAYNAQPTTAVLRVDLGGIGVAITDHLRLTEDEFGNPTGGRTLEDGTPRIAE